MTWRPGASSRAASLPRVFFLLFFLSSFTTGQRPFVGIVQQIFVENEGEDEQIGCVWFYGVQEALNLAGVARPHHPKELMFSVHYDEPGKAEDILLNKVKVLFFGRLPDLANPVVAHAIEKADYFCAQTYHFQQKKVENNDTAKLTTGQMRRLFAQLGQLIQEGDRVVAASTEGAADANADKPIKVRKPKKATPVASAAPVPAATASNGVEAMDLEDDVFDNEGGAASKASEAPRKTPLFAEPELVTGRRAAAKKAEEAIRIRMEKEQREEKRKPAVVRMEMEEDGDVVIESITATDGEEEELADGVDYEVEDVLDDRVLGGRRQYYVKWKDYDHAFNTWEDEDNCDGCPEILKAYITRRYHDFPDKFLSMMKSFKRAPRPGAGGAAGAAGLQGLPPDVRFYHDLKNNMIVLLGGEGNGSGAHKWVVANMRRDDGDGDRKRSKVPPPPPDNPQEGMDVLGVWGNGVAPPWVRKVSSLRIAEADTARVELMDMRKRDSRSTAGAWTRENTYRFGGKQWFTIFGWAILERAPGAVQALLQLNPGIHLEPCCGDVAENNGITRVDGMFLAAWNARKDVVAVLLRNGASPFTVSMWSGFAVCIPLEIVLVFYYMNLGGLINEAGVRAENPKAILAAMKDSLVPGMPFARNALYHPRVREDDQSPHAQTLIMFQTWMKNQPEMAAGGSQEGDFGMTLKQTAKRTGHLKKSIAANAKAAATPGAVAAPPPVAPRPTAALASSAPSSMPPMVGGPPVDPRKAPRESSASRGNGSSTGNSYGNETFKDVQMEANLANGLEERGMGVYKEMLERGRIYSVTQMRALNDNDLRAIGVKPFHASKMLAMAAQLLIEQSKAAEERKRKAT
jgi:hypothetical protein